MAAYRKLAALVQLAIFIGMAQQFKKRSTVRETKPAVAELSDSKKATRQPTKSKPSKQPRPMRPAGRKRGSSKRPKKTKTTK